MWQVTRTIFSKLSYPKEMINSIIHRFGQDRTERNATPRLEPSVYIRLSFKDQHSANRVRREIHSLESKIDIRIQPAFTSKKLSQVLSVKEIKPPIVNTRCVVYFFECDLCDANYVGYTARHLYQRISEHHYSAIRKNLATQQWNMVFEYFK